MIEIQIPELDVPFLFRQRPMPMPADLRPAWRVAVLLLILRKCCRSGRSSFARLHVLNWAVRSPDGMQAIRKVLAGTQDPDDVLIRIEPSLNKAIQYAVAESVMTITRGDHVELTAKGIDVAEDISSAGGLLESEEVFLQEIGQRITEALVDRLLRGSGGT
jgi:hypothetical protein